MGKFLAKFLLSLTGWTVDYKLPDEASRCIMIASPHTTNWDLWYMRLAFYVLGIPMKFTIKKEWTRFPFSLIIKPLGGLGIDRRPKTEGAPRRSYTEVMQDFFKAHEKIAVVVTPEGSRSLRTQWKTGFYYTALAAKVPICFGYLDYKKKIAGVGGVIHPTGNYEKDMEKIMNFYVNISGKFPEKFSVDKRFYKAKKGNIH